MAAPKGNKYAVGSKNNGAPRTTSPSDEELEILGQEMIDWVKANEPIHLSQWYSMIKKMTYEQWKAIIQIKVFLPYYQEALQRVGMKYLDGTINPSIAQRWQRVYFKDLKEEENEKLELEIKLKAQESKPPHDQTIDVLLDTIKSLKDAQSKTD